MVQNTKLLANYFIQDNPSQGQMNHYHSSEPSLLVQLVASKGIYPLKQQPLQQKMKNEIEKIIFEQQ